MNLPSNLRILAQQQSPPGRVVFDTAYPTPCTPQPAFIFDECGVKLREQLILAVEYGFVCEIMMKNKCCTFHAKAQHLVCLLFLTCFLCFVLLFVCCLLSVFVLFFWLYFYYSFFITTSCSGNSNWQQYLCSLLFLYQKRVFLTQGDKITTTATVTSTTSTPTPTQDHKKAIQTHLPKYNLSRFLHAQVRFPQSS